MPGRTYQAGSGSYRYSINGQEKTPEIAPNTTTAVFWEYDARIGRRWNLDPRPNVSISPYNCFAGNPIFYFDNKGDSVGLGNLYEKDVNGLYKHTNEIFAFELFAKTKEGEKYIRDRAHSGFKLKGVFVNGLNIDVKTEGAESKKGIDINLDVVPVNTIQSNTGAGRARTGDYNTKDGRLKLSFQIEEQPELSTVKDWQEARDKMLEHVDDWAHEFYLHGDLQEKRFLFGSKIKWDSHNPSSWIPSKFGGESNIGFDLNKSQAYINSHLQTMPQLRVLNEVQQLKIVFNQGLQPHSLDYLFKRIMLKGLGITTLDYYESIPKY